MIARWHSIHAYYHADLDALLTGCLGPWLASRGASDPACRLFFIRHWQGGPHLRIRLWSNDPAEPAALADVISHFLKSRPSMATLSAHEYATIQALFGSLEGAFERPPLRPDNSAVIDHYAPEYGKYGGERGVAIAENLFVESTRIALDATRASGQSRGRRLGAGFAMFLAAVTGFGLASGEVAAFARAYERSWPTVSPESRRRWHGMFETLWPDLKSVAERMLDGRPSRSTSRWMEAVRTAAGELDQDDGLIYEAMDADMPNEAKRRRLLMQYIHTHHNRLGIGIDYEAYLAFLVASCLDRLGWGGE